MGIEGMKIPELGKFVSTSLTEGAQGKEGMAYAKQIFKNFNSMLDTKIARITYLFSGGAEERGWIKSKDVYEKILKEVEDLKSKLDSETTLDTTQAEPIHLLIQEMRTVCTLLQKNKKFAGSAGDLLTSLGGLEEKIRLLAPTIVSSHKPTLMISDKAFTLQTPTEEQAQEGKLETDKQGEKARKSVEKKETYFEKVGKIKREKIKAHGRPRQKAAEKSEEPVKVSQTKAKGAVQAKMSKKEAREKVVGTLKKLIENAYYFGSDDLLHALGAWKGEDSADNQILKSIQRKDFSQSSFTDVRNAVNQAIDRIEHGFKNMKKPMPDYIDFMIKELQTDLKTFQSFIKTEEDFHYTKGTKKLLEDEERSELTQKRSAEAPESRKGIKEEERSELTQKRSAEAPESRKGIKEVGE